MSTRNNLYLGKAGQFAVMAEVLMRGWNVAIPEVDVGDDLFVVRDKEGTMTRVQVKTANAATSPTKKGPTRLMAQFSAKWGQIATPHTPELTYVFVVRHGAQWLAHLVLSRRFLYDAYVYSRVKGLPTPEQQMTPQLYFELDAANIIQRVLFLGQDVTSALNDYSLFPVIRH